MNNDAQTALRQAIGALLNADSADSLEIQRLDQGLSNVCFLCKSGSEKYFVKVYAPGPQSGQQVRGINRIIASMRAKGIPAPELLAYSPDYPNVVIHRWVESASLGWGNNLLEPVARLYSDVVKIGLLTRRSLSREAYLNNLQKVLNAVSRQALQEPVAAGEPDQRASQLARQAVSLLAEELPHSPLPVLLLHDDFTENNILADERSIKLLCDWDSYRPAMLWENLAASASRFCTSAPRRGELCSERLDLFLRGVSPQVLQQIDDPARFARLFPILSILRHLRVYPFRRQLATRQRTDLRTALLDEPIGHCEWMLEHAGQVSQWVAEHLAARNA